jgi:ubiquinone/menaquinone biosynthesis C-methylase UbiE
MKLRRERLDQLLDGLDEVSQDMPLAVVVIMHELFRNLYPDDPHIPFAKTEDPLVRLDRVLVWGERMLRNFATMGSYRMSGCPLNSPHGDLKDATGDVYSPLWQNYDSESFTSEGSGILRQRWASLPIPLGNFVRGSALDAGCGSGRFTFGLKDLGFDSVVGADWNTVGYGWAEALANQQPGYNISFVKADLLNLPWSDESFDFVFSNGTAHHTGNTFGAVAEVVRVMKPGGYAWLYLYGAGGHFWHARRRMPEIMKKIPQSFTMNVLDCLGMPKSRFVFTDNWYVPLEDHTTDLEARTMLQDLGVQHVWRVFGGRTTDLPCDNTGSNGEMYGDGELRYLLSK